MHVLVPNPDESRKEVLEGCIDIVRMLKSFEKIRVIRKEKALYINYLKKEMKEFKGVLINLDNLPKVKVEQREREEKKLKKEERKIESPKRNPELEKLEKDIRELQSKISVL